MIVLYILAAAGLMFLLYILFLTVCALLVDPTKEYGKDSRFYRFLLYSATDAALKLLRIQVHTTGTEKLPPDKKILFVGNHRSNFDPIITWHIFKDHNLAFISKAENFKIPWFGRIIRRCCFMAIDRENPRNAITTINKAAALLARQEVSIGVYPEGTRSKDGTLLPFHNGVFKIAQKADADIAVLAVRGTETIHKRVPFRTCHVYLDVVEVIAAAEIRKEKTDAIGSRVRMLLEN